MKNTYKFVCLLLPVLFLFSFSGCADIFEEKAGDTSPIGSTPVPSLSESISDAETRSEGETSNVPAENEDETLTGEELSERPSEEQNTPPFTYPASDYEHYTAVCAKTGLNVRKGCGTDEPVIGYLGTGRSLPYLETEGGWYRVYTEDGVGYVSAAYSYLSETCSAVERIVEAGLAKLGTPYVWGAPRIIDGDGNVSPYFTGKSFDCSSFVQYCYYVGDGVKLGNYTGSQADYTVGKVITRYGDLRRGDFYFTGSGSISHVVIYMGGGRLLQAYSANGGPVSFTTDDRWRSKFISGRSVDLSVKNQYR